MRTKEKLAKETDEFVNKLIKLLKEDPLADKHDIDYLDNEYIKEYLYDIIEDNGSLAHGLVVAMEVFLEK